MLMVVVVVLVLVLVMVVMVGDGGAGWSVAPADEVATVQQLWRKEEAFVGETRQRQ